MIKALHKVKINLISCNPPFWASTGHLQTILGHLLPSPSVGEESVTFRVGLGKDTEQIHTTYLKGTTKIVVYLFHGLGGSAEATYMHRTALVARSFGHHVFINNHRGCGQGVGLASEPYHSGRAEDLSSVIAFGRKMLPDHHHIAIGFSLSANALLLLSAGVRADILPDMSIAVNGPINLARTALNLGEGLNRIYDKRFVLELKRYVKVNHPSGFEKVKNIKLLRDFDEAYTAPVGGFKNREEYYRTCSAKQYLKQIRIPTVLLTAEDDPFVDVQDYLEAEISPTVILHIEKHGGHMGYLSKKGLGYERWLDMALHSYLKAATSSFLSESVT